MKYVMLAVVFVFVAFCVPTVAGADLEIDSRLSSYEEDECAAWADYFKARYSLLVPSLGESSYRRFLGQALSRFPNSEYLFDKWRLGRDLENPSEDSIKDFEAVWCQNPNNARLTQIYVDLLNRGGRQEDARRVLFQTMEHLDWSSGALAITVVIMAPHVERSKLMEMLLGRVERHVAGKELSLSHLAWACYWRDCGMFARALAGEEGIGWLKRWRLEQHARGYFSRSLIHVRKSYGDLQSFSFFQTMLVLNVLEGLEKWEEVLRVLDKLSTDSQVRSLVWYFMYKGRALAALKRMDELKGMLDEIKFGSEWNSDILQFAAEMYLDELKDYGRASEIYDMLVTEEPRNLRYRLMAAQLSLFQNQSVKGLSILAPVSKLPPAGMVLQAKLLSQKGSHEKAYHVMKALELEALASGDKAEEILTDGFYHTMVPVCLELDKRDDAVKYVKKIYELDKDSANGCNYYGYLLADFNRELPLAEKLIRQALLEEPGNAAYIDSLGWVFYRQGAVRKAVLKLAEVVRNNGLSDDAEGELNEHLGKVVRDLGYPRLADYYDGQAKELKQ